MEPTDPIKQQSTSTQDVSQTGDVVQPTSSSVTSEVPTFSATSKPHAPETSSVGQPPMSAKDPVSSATSNIESTTSSTGGQAAPQATTLPTVPPVDNVTPSVPSTSAGGDNSQVNVVPKKHVAGSKIPYIIAVVLFIISIGGGVFLAMNYLMPSASGEQSSSKESAGKEVPTVEPSPTPIVEALEELPVLGVSDDVDTIEKDLEMTSLSDLDKDMSTLDSQLGQ